ncbi:MAG: hypothetical protein FH756_03805 [Firmicutes bacterium]|nr:hypothetical protein [Bacillota bacterium]
MAGQVKEKFPDDVEVETVYSGFIGLGHKGDSIKPPNITVDDEKLGGKVTYEELEKKVLQRKEHKDR